MCGHSAGAKKRHLNQISVLIIVLIISNIYTESVLQIYLYLIIYLKPIFIICAADNTKLKAFLPTDNICENLQPLKDESPSGLI